MKLEDAQTLLPQFLPLEGTFSEFYDSKILTVFVTYTEGSLAELHYNRHIKKTFDKSLPTLSPREDNYTIAAALENGDVVSVKSIVLHGKINPFIEAAASLEYMQYNGNDINPAEIL